MSFSKTLFFKNFWWHTILILSGVVIRNCGISLTSGHCTNAANRHYNAYRNFSRSYNLVADQTLMVLAKKGQDLRFSIRLEQSRPLFITLTSSNRNEIDYQLYFNETVNLSKYLHMNLTSNSSKLTLPCAFIGQYDILVMSNINTELHINYTLQVDIEEQLSKYIQKSRIRYENRFHKHQALFKWDKSKLDIHTMQYCLAINTKKSEESLCEAIDSILGRSPKQFCSQIKAINKYYIRLADNVIQLDPKRANALACTGQRNKQIIQGFMPNKKYFVDIFGIHSDIAGLTFKLGATTIFSKRSNSIELQDGRIALGRISKFDKKSVFSFRIFRKLATVRLFIIPCGFVIRTKIFNQKHLKAFMDIDQPTEITFNNSMNLDRYLFKFYLSNPDDSMQNVNFKIVATTKDRFDALPILPDKTSVEEIKSLRTCRTATITWYASPDIRNIRYCITIIKVRSIEDNSFVVNTCNLEKSSGKIMSTNKSCIWPSAKRDGKERYELTDLMPNHNYIIQLIIKMDNQSLPYRSLHLSKGQHHCFFPKILQNELPILITANRNHRKTSAQQYEDNNVLVP